MKNSLVGLTILACLISACQKAESPKAEQPKNNAVPKNLVQRVENIRAGTRVDECDHHWFERRMEMAADLDRREDAIKTEAQKNQSAHPFYKILNFGPTFVREPLTPPNAHGPNEDIVSWDEAYQWYNSIKGTQTSYGWYAFQKYFSGILLDDYRRSVNEVNFFYNFNAELPLLEISSVITKCLNGLFCNKLDFTFEQELFIAQNPILNKEYSSAKQEQFSKKSLRHFFDVVEDDTDDFKFHPNETVVRSKDGWLHVPLDPQKFTGFETQSRISALLENMWRKSDDTLRVKIDWKSVQDNPKIYKLVLRTESGSRAAVSPKSRSMNLPHGFVITALAHEFGHILGFPDNYITIYQPKNCSYYFKSNYDDIMSESETGHVTEEEWAKLESQYPKPL